MATTRDHVPRFADVRITTVKLCLYDDLVKFVDLVHVVSLRLRHLITIVLFSEHCVCAVLLAHMGYLIVVGLPTIVYCVPFVRPALLVRLFRVVFPGHYFLTFASHSILQQMRRVMSLMLQAVELV